MGNIIFTSKYIQKEPDPPVALNPALNNNCYLNLVVCSAKFLKDADWLGK